MKNKAKFGTSRNRTPYLYMLARRMGRGAGSGSGFWRGFPAPKPIISSVDGYASPGLSLYQRGRRKSPWPGAPPSRRQASPRRCPGGVALPSRRSAPAEAGKMPALPAAAARQARRNDRSSRPSAGQASLCPSYGLIVNSPWPAAGCRAFPHRRTRPPESRMG